jgi:hypothetical protein
MLALAFIMARAAAAATPSPSHPWRHAYIPGPIALTAAEIRRLFNGLVTGPLRDRLPGPARAISEIQHWTNWRRHYHGQAAKATTSADSPLNSTHNELTLPYERVRAVLGPDGQLAGDRPTCGKRRPRWPMQGSARRV